MTLRLSSTENVGVKTGWAYGNDVGIGEWHMPEYRISMSDFLAACFYALTNTDLVEDDPRPEFLEKIKHLKIVPGWNADREPDCKRLALREEAERS